MAVPGYAGVPKLKGRENFETWKFAAEATLDVEGLWEVVCGRETETNPTKLAELNRKAKSRIILMIEPVNYVHVMGETTAKGVWEKLQSAFEDSGLLRRVGVLRSLLSTKLEDCSSMEEFVHQVISTAHKLSGAGMKLNDEWIGTILLAGLSARYEPMIMAIESSGVKISSDLIKTKLLQDTATEANNCESSMYTRNMREHKTHHTTHTHNDHDQGQHRQSRRTVKCYKCGKMGHFSRECRSSKPSVSGKGNRDRNETTWSCITDKYDSDAWYIDSGASAHMTKQVEIVEQVRASDSGTVTVANSSDLEVKGQGVVKLCTDKMDINVTKVLVVPNICANLLSVSSMVRNGMQIVFNSNGCNIEIEKSGAVVATASEVNGVYRLNTKHSTASSGLLAEKNDTSETML